MSLALYDYQIDAVNQLRNGCILDGDVGTGKSRTSLAYWYFRVCKGQVPVNGKGTIRLMKDPRDLYIITTAKKRDSHEWEEELANFGLIGGVNKDDGVTITIDSWNNIKKYKNVYGAMFIFDEQRVVGSGSWVKAFLNIARKNHWILLSATPGDTWSDYIPVFVANGFYSNKTEFAKRHCVYSRYAKYPKIERYVDQGILAQHRADILVHMTMTRETVPHHVWIPCAYDKELYKTVWKDRWDPYDNKPIEETGKLFYLLRKVVNSDASRIEEVRTICRRHRKVIIFYNHTYELHTLRESLVGEVDDIGEWNGEVHTPVPTSEDSWVYLVQYIAASEGWNCIRTNCIVFYSQDYSYRRTKQAEGRIDRVNTPFKDLYYYHLRSSAPIDLAIARALKQKKNFNERTFLKH